MMEGPISNIFKFQEVGSLLSKANMAMEIFVKRVYYFRDKCVVFARNLKFSNLTQKIFNIYHVIVHSLPKKHCFYPKRHF